VIIYGSSYLTWISVFGKFHSEIILNNNRLMLSLLEFSDAFRKEIETIMQKWIKLLHNLDPKFMEMLKMQLDYENRLENLRIFLREEVDKEIEKAFHSEFPNEEFTPNIKKKIDKLTSSHHEQLLETIEKLE